MRNKNIRDFLGKPLIEYTIDTAKVFKDRHPEDNVHISVNSDSAELLSIARKDKDVEIIQRPEVLAQDNSPKIPVIQYSLEEMEEKNSIQYDYVIDLDITSPLRRVGDIENALQKSIENKEADVVFSVVPARRNPYFNMVELTDGKVKKVLQSDFVARQQAPEVYDMNASIYCFKRNSLKNIFKTTPFDGRADIILMEDTGILDIDSEEDFELMKLIAPYFLNKFMEEK